MRMGKVLSSLALALLAGALLGACDEAGQQGAQIDLTGEATQEGDLEGLGGPDDVGQVTICHSTGSDTNPYEEIRLSLDAIEAHRAHEGDLIPAPDEGCPTELVEPTAEATQEGTEEAVTCEDGDTIADILNAYEDEDDDDVEAEFEEFSKMLEDAPEVLELLDEEGEYTVFAPIDDAFEGDDGNDFDGDALRELALYHIVDGALNAEDLRDMTSVTAMNGKEITISAEGDEIVLNGEARIVIEEIEACNGVIHAIDRALLPEDDDSDDNDNDDNGNDNADNDNDDNGNSNDNADNGNDNDDDDDDNDNGGNSGPGGDNDNDDDDNDNG